MKDYIQRRAIVFVRLVALAMIVVLIGAGCLSQKTETSGAPLNDQMAGYEPTSISDQKDEVEDMANMEITSAAFKDMGSIPKEYTCDGDNVSPPLSIRGVPEGTRSLALLVDDPDAPAGDWVHWLMWDIKPTTSEIARNSVPDGAVQGQTDFRENGWGGPCPPSGTHRYFFKVYALDSRPDLGRNAKKSDFLVAIKGHILAQAQIVGTYKRA
jgi:Raf kinase inhibitor-like YbhB/YbcL family protein